VVWDSNFASLSPQDSGWKLEFQNGTAAYADIVIAADGANSRIRAFITHIKPFYTGVSVVEGSVYNSETASPKIHKLLNGGKIFAMGDEKTLIVSSKGDGSLVFYFGWKTDEFWTKENGIDFSDKAQVFAWFKKEFKGWDAVWEELFENANPVFVLRPQYCMPLDQTWESLPNLTMLGDAAHLMPPYAGEGVNMAMLDALELAQCLLSHGFTDTHEAIAAFEKQMLARFAEVGQITLEQTASLHSIDAIKNILELFRPND
jgi:2-polyprenyl-6-methoxyphenol hydroxylase-like FAD-dependent oxidoreductase